jgi:hypothetical protein
MNLLRSVVAFLLLAAAAALGVGGAVAQWADRAARTSGPMREIVAPITHFETTRSALAGVLTERAVSEIPTIAEAVPGLTGLIEGLISDAVAATLDDPGVDRAWIAALDSTRAGVVADIEGYDGGTPPTLWFDLAPFGDLARDRLVSAAPDRVKPFVEEISWTTELRAPMVRLDPTQTELAAGALKWTSRWGWFYAGAAVLAVVGLVVGPRRGRWVALLAAALLTLAGLAAADSFLWAATIPDRSGLGPELARIIVESGTAHLAQWLHPGRYVALGAAGLGALGIWYTWPRRHRGIDG